jgi:hypothetical protein
MLIEATLVGLGILVWRKLGQTKEWTAENEEMYQAALEHLKGEAGVAKLYEIADACEKNGHHTKAFALRERAKLRSTPEKVKRERKAVYMKAMQSENVAGILKVAAAFESITATGAAANLRARATELQAAQDAMTGAPTPEVPQARVAPTPPGEQAHEPSPAPEQTPVAQAASESIVTEAEPVVQEAPKAQPARARVSRAREVSGLQEVRAEARPVTKTTPAPPPPAASMPVIDVEVTTEELNGAGHANEEVHGTTASS